MKKIILCLFTILFFNLINAQDSASKKLIYNPKKPTYELAATCGTCMFKMKGDICLWVNQKIKRGKIEYLDYLTTNC